MNGQSVTFGEKVDGLTKANPLTLTGSVNLAEGEHALTFAAALGNGTPVATTISGVIDGKGGFIKDGPSTLILSGNKANTYTGGTTLADGDLILNKANALGTGPITLNGGKLIVNKAGALGTGNGGGALGALTLNNGLIRAGDSGPQTIANPVEVKGNVTFGEKINVNVKNVLTLSGPVRLEEGYHTFSVAAASKGNPDVSTVISGKISGTGGFIKDGPSTLILAGKEANTYEGQTTVLGGTLLLNKRPGESALSSNLIIGMGGQAGIVKLDNNNQLADATGVTINTGTLDLNGKKDAIPSLSGTEKAVISFDGPTGFGGTPGPKGQLTVTEGTFAGTLLGSGTLTKVGAGAGAHEGLQGLYHPPELGERQSGDADGEWAVRQEQERHRQRPQRRQPRWEWTYQW